MPMLPGPCGRGTGPNRTVGKFDGDTRLIALFLLGAIGNYDRAVPQLQHWPRRTGRAQNPFPVVGFRELGRLAAQLTDRGKDGIELDVQRGVEIGLNVNVVLKGRHESGERDLNRIQAGAKPLAYEDAVFVRKQLDGAAAGKFRSQPHGRSHLRIAGRIGHVTAQLTEIIGKGGRSDRGGKCHIARRPRFATTSPHHLAEDVCAAVVTLVGAVTLKSADREML